MVIEQAVREAERDCEDWKKRSHDEEGQLEKIGALEKLEEEVRDSISDEVRELEMIKKQCDKDCRSIGVCILWSDVWCPTLP